MKHCAFAIGFALILLAQPARADFRSCVRGLAEMARADGVSAATVERATRNLSYDPDIIKSEHSQPEFTTPIWDYIAGLVDDERVADGRAAMRRWGHWLAIAQRRYGVDASIIAAIWGVESNFGKGFGKHPVVQSLAILSCAGGRERYFRSEFVDALKIIDRGDVNPAHFDGSWAGAFGNTQFMPSTFLSMAVDLDGDGHSDLIGSVPDALGSTANFLRRHGYVRGLSWGFEVRLPRDYHGPSGRRNKRPMAYWANRGIVHVDGAPLRGGTRVGLFLPAGPHGPAFLVTRNFDAIYSYNAADSYALAIALLSDRLRGAHGLVTPWPTNDPGLSRAGRREIQALLIRRGYDLDGKIDGILGKKTQAAIADFQARSGMTPNGRACASVLAALKRR
ncbi:MAG: lytic murein transglycosylase [Beijerinckiaceae bacterium]|nr:MAG: lytic murein transglycosylase [Beijerinckiaceae bacterium]